MAYDHYSNPDILSILAVDEFIQQGTDFKHIYGTQAIAKIIIILLLNDLNRHISKEDIQMTNKHVKLQSIIIVKEMHIKTRYSLTPVIMAIIKTIKYNQC
jgi:hypothetical protein